MKKFLVLCLFCFVGNISSSENITRSYDPDCDETGYTLIDANKKKAYVGKGELGYASSFDPEWRFKDMDFVQYLKWLGVSDSEAFYNLIEQKYNAPHIRSCLKQEKN